MMKSHIFTFAALFALLVSACVPVLTPTPTPPPILTEEPQIPVTGLAGIQSVEIQIPAAQPLQVNAIVRGQLPDAGCTSISNISQTREGNTFKLTFTTTTDPLAVCPLVITPFEQVIALDVSNLPPAEYFVNVNGIVLPFELLPRDLGGFQKALVDALNARSYELLKLMMHDSFTIGYWRSEGTAQHPDQGIEQLRTNLLNSSAPIYADYTKNLIELLGTDPVTIVDPQLVGVTPLFITGLGSAGKGEAILFTANLPDGSLYWHGLLFAQDGFARPTPTSTPPPIVIQPIDTNAYPTSVQFVMALQEVRMRNGPGTQFSIIGYIAAGQTAKVTGVSANGYWWRVICPNNTVGSCWVSADPTLTKPTSSPAPDTTAYPTDVQFIMAQRDATMYSGPGTQFSVISYIAAGQTAKVTGVNLNGKWWRVICPDTSVGSCWVSADPSFTRPTTPTVNADVQSVEIQILESYPLQVNAIARGYLPDAGCTTIAGITQKRTGNTFTVTVTTKFNPQVLCAQALTPFEQVIPLEVGSLLPGTYLVVVNGVQASFVLPESYIPTDVQYVMAQRDVTMYSGPGTQYSVIGGVASGQTAKVTGVSSDARWWRVICPDNTIGSCWVSASPADTQPTQWQ